MIGPHVALLGSDLLTAEAIMKSLVLMSSSLMLIGLTAHAGVKCREAVKSGAFPMDSFSAVGSLGLESLRNSNSAETKKWVEIQNAKTTEALGLNKSLNMQKKLQDRLAARSPSNPAPFVETTHGDLMTKGGNLVLRLKDGTEKVIVQHVVHNSKEKSVVAEFKLSPNGDLVAASLVRNGNDQNFWSVYRISTGEKLAGPFEVRLNDFSFSHDSDSIFYTKWPSIDEANAGVLYANNYTVNLRTLKQNIVFVPPAKDSREIYTIETFITTDGKPMLLASRTQGAAEVPVAIHVGELGKADLSKGEFQVGFYKWKTLMPSKRERLGKVIGVRNGEILIRTAEEANYFEIEALNPITGARRKVVKEIKGSVLVVSQLINDRLYNQYLNSQTHENFIAVFDLSGRQLAKFDLSEFSIPKTGTLSPLVGTHQSENLYFAYHDTLLPHVTFTLNKQSLKLTMVASKPVDFAVEKVSYKLIDVQSADGTLIPMKVYQRKDQVKPRFVYLFYYGHIGITQQPQWNKKFQHMLDLGGAVVIVSPRGGGLKGRDWQLKGKESETARIDDILAAGRWLRSNFSDSPVLASGRSFGGLLTAQLMIQGSKYNLFDAFSSTVPVTDLNEFLNRELFGRMAGDDFDVPRDSNGSIIDSPEFREKMKRLSPLAQLKQLKEKDLKPVLISSGGSDDRVGEAQARFLTQALHNQFPNSKEKVLLYEDPYTGHSSRSEDIREALFVMEVFGIKESEIHFLTK